MAMLGWVCVWQACDCWELPFFGFYQTSLFWFILGIPALFVEKFVYCKIRMGMKFLKGCRLDFSGLIQTQIQSTH